MITNATHLEKLNSPIRELGILVNQCGNVPQSIGGIYSQNKNLISLTVERQGEDKFFGFGICQKLTLVLQDKERKIPTTYGNFQVRMAVDGNNRLRVFPTFKLEEVTRDEVAGNITFTAYDSLYRAVGLTVNDLGLSAPYTIEEFIAAAATALTKNAYLVQPNILVEDEVFQLAYPDGANFDGTESLRNALDAIAEATQTIYYLDAGDGLVFKRLDRDGDAVYSIDKSKYFSLDSKTNRTLSTICSTTELGDNITSAAGNGVTQYVRENPFWNMRDDVAELVDNAAAAICGITANQFTCSWRGNYLLEPGDKIDMVTKNNQVVTSYILSDTITYNGGLKEVTSWQFTDDADEQQPANPTTLGEALKQTFAKVDKINQEIDLVASRVDANSSSIAALEINTESINASVESVVKEMDEVNDEIEELRKLVELQITDEDLSIKIQEELKNGITSVTTTTGFTFNEEGLTISKSDSDISTQITEDGMTVSKNDEELLVADSEGVKAKNLHATTYLVIGKYSRFEDYTNQDGEARTGCFWIGG